MLDVGGDWGAERRLDGNRDYCMHIGRDMLGSQRGIAPWNLEILGFSALIVGYGSISHHSKISIYSVYSVSWYSTWQ